MLDNELELAVPIIEHPRESALLNECLSIGNYQWTCRQKPLTRAFLFICNTDLYVRFKVQEKAPRALCSKHLQRVCEDSAVELFLAFPQEPCDDPQSFRPECERDLYLNLEFNAKGACYAKYGTSRRNRTAFTEAQLAALEIKPDVHEDHWMLDFKVPGDLIAAMTGYQPFLEGRHFALNAYKISETAEIEHYASFSKIDSETPNFHRPDCFAAAVGRRLSL